MEINKSRLVVVGVIGSLAVAISAFGAHGLNTLFEAGKVTAKQLHGFETGAQYHLFFSIALLFFCFVPNDRKLNLSYKFILAGMGLFSGSLYLLGLRDVLQMPALKMVGPITPIGGVCFIIAFVCLILFGLEKKDA